MPVVNHRRFVEPQAGHHRLAKRLCLALAIMAGVFMAGNIGMMIIYKDKALPHTRLGNAAIGGKSFRDLEHLPSTTGIEPSIRLQHEGKQKTLAVKDLGFSMDISASAKKVRKHWQRWLPVTSLVRGATIPVVLRVDDDHFRQTIAKEATLFERPAMDVHVAFNGQQFASAPASNGIAVNVSATQLTVQKAIAAGSPSVQVVTSVTKPTVHNADLSGAANTLNKQITTTISFSRFGGSKVQPTATQKAAWYVQNGQSMTLSEAKIATYIEQTAAQQKMTLLNKDDLVTAVTYALTHQQAIDLRLVAEGNVLRTYCTAAKGVSANGLADLNGKLAAVYADARGWNTDGRIGFKHVDSGCQYTVWLSAPSMMGSFGSICDDYYNCQVGGSVVVNNDRWTQATPAWNSTGGSLEDYRVLIIDHETGHRLGFVDNPVCPAPGGPAPVMMQQSIDLAGCTFNVWPTAAEIAKLKSTL